MINLEVELRAQDMIQDDTHHVQFRVHAGRGPCPCPLPSLQEPCMTKYPRTLRTFKSHR